MQWTAMWRMALALLPTSLANAARGYPQDDAEREQQRALLAETVSEYARVASQYLVKIAQFSALVFLLFAVATILYSVMYYLVIPSRLHEQEIFFNYGTHAALSVPLALAKAATEIPLPTAQLNLLDAEHQWTASPLVELPPPPTHVLVPGVRYDVIVELTVPESKVNQDIGMFMIETTLASQHSGVLATSARPAIVKGSHILVQWTRVVAWLLPYAMRLTDPAQTLIVPVVNGYKESKNHPLTRVDIRLNHPALQVYEAKLTIIAQLSGVRYLMYHWSVPTALLVIFHLVLLEALALLVMYAYYQLPGDSTVDNTTPRDDDEPDEMALDKAEQFERHRSGGIPPVHVERAIKQEPMTSQNVDSQRPVTTSSLLADDIEWKLRYRGGNGDASAAINESFEST